MPLTRSRARSWFNSSSRSTARISAGSDCSTVDPSPLRKTTVICGFGPFESLATASSSRPAVATCRLVAIRAKSPRLSITNPVPVPPALPTFTFTKTVDSLSLEMTEAGSIGAAAGVLGGADAGTGWKSLVVAATSASAGNAPEPRAAPAAASDAEGCLPPSPSPRIRRNTTTSKSEAQTPPIAMAA